jgi:hypothetical protein
MPIGKVPENPWRGPGGGGKEELNAIYAVDIRVWTVC